MEPSSSRVRLWTLVREDLRGLPRNTFALAAVSAVFGLLAVPTSFLIAGEAGLDETLLLTWLVVPMAVAILVASRVAGARRTRFVDSLYTTPLTQPTWIFAQAIVGAFLGLLILLVQVPFLLVYVAWLGVPAVLLPAALAAMAIAAFAVALGLFCGVVVGEASPLAAAGLAGGIAFVSFVLFLVHSVALSETPSTGRDVLLRVTALSPITLAADASGMGIAGVEPADAWRPIVGLAALTAGLAAAAWVAYTRAQGPVGWEPRRGRAVVAALVAMAVVAPVATAEVGFVDASSDIQGYSPGENTWVAFVAPGSPIGEESFTDATIFDAPDLTLGKDRAYDVLVLLLAPSGLAVQAVDVRVKGSDVVRVVDGGARSVPSGTADGHAPAPNDGQPRPVYRVPVTLRVLSVEELAESLAPVEVHTEFRADGKRHTSVAYLYLDGEVPAAAGQLLAAGLVLPSAALAGFVQRKRSTR